MDRRDMMRAMGHWWGSLDERRMVATVIGEDGETEVEIPVVFEMCSTCGGKGTHVNPSIDAHGISEDEWDQEWSSDEQEMYLTGGYDVECGECAGRRVVPVPAPALTDEQRTALSAALGRQDERLADHRTFLMESGLMP